ncbi:hypothetical protein [Flavobacterium sp. 3-210]
MKTNIFYIIIKNTPTMIVKLLCDIVLIADTRPTFIEKLKYFGLIITTFGPIAWLLEGLTGWYLVNKQFAGFVLLAVVFNLVIGAWYHHKMNSFSWEEFLKKNILMITVLFLSYTMLEMLRLTAGDNFAAESFRIIIQVSSLLYPVSKCLKNLYILSNKQFPPAFIMERLYNFEKTGNLKDLFPDEPKN